MRKTIEINIVPSLKNMHSYFRLNIRRLFLGGIVTILLMVVACYVVWDGNTVFGTEAVSVNQKPKLDVPYEPTSYGIAKVMLAMADVTAKDLVYDLGCGDGRIVIMAAKERKARGVGVDIDPVRIKESIENAKAAGVSNLVRFIEQDLFITDITPATVMMLYLWPEVNIKLRPKLLKDLKPGTRIVSHSHTMGGWKADATQNVEGHSLYLYIVPVNLTGTWLWTGLNGKATNIRMTQKFQEVQGTLPGNNNEPFLTCSLKGAAICCTTGSFSIEGHVSGDVIKGAVNYGVRGPTRTVKATRNPSTKVSIAE